MTYHVMSDALGLASPALEPLQRSGGCVHVQPLLEGLVLHGDCCASCVTPSAGLLMIGRGSWSRAISLWHAWSCVLFFR